jgi:hypothetical protein
LLLAWKLLQKTLIRKYKHYKAPPEVPDSQTGLFDGIDCRRELDPPRGKLNQGFQPPSTLLWPVESRELMLLPAAPQEQAVEEQGQRRQLELLL